MTPTNSDTTNVTSKARRDVTAAQKALHARLLASRVSRRELVALTVGAVASSPLWGPLARAVSSFSVDRDATSVRIRSGNVSLFEVSTALFDGAPRIDSRHEASISPSKSRVDGYPVRMCRPTFASSRSASALAGMPVSSCPRCDSSLNSPSSHGSSASRSTACSHSAPCLPNCRMWRSSHRGSPGQHSIQAGHSILESRRKLELSTLAGAMHVDDIQVDLAAPSEPSIGGERPHVARTRIWAVGGCTSSQPVRVDGARVRFSTRRLMWCWNASRSTLHADHAPHAREQRLSGCRPSTPLSIDRRRRCGYDGTPVAGGGGRYGTCACRR